MKRLILLAALAAPAPLAAETIAVFGPDLYTADCVEGAGCTCAPSAVDRVGAGLALDTDPLSESVLGLVSSPVAELEPTNETADALHARFGGQGACPAAAIVPKDGLWAFTPSPVQASPGCRPEVKPMADPMLAAQAQSHEIKWEGVFHPDKLRVSAGGPAIDWRQVSQNAYVGIVGPVGEGPVKIAVRYTSRLVAPDRALSRATVDFRGVKELAALGMADCVLSVDLEGQRTGD